MKYIIAVVGLIVVVIIGSFLWSAASDIFSGDVSFFSLPFLNFSTSQSVDNTTTSPTNTKDRTSRTSTDRDTTQRTETRTSQQEEESVTPPSSREESVYISSYDNFSSGDEPQSLRLGTNLRQGELINVTDWRVKTNQAEFTIPQAVNTYRFSKINESADIILKPGDNVRIYFEEKPIPHNLRLNKCTGYLNQIYDLDFFFPKRCPQPDRDDYKHLSGECQNIIERISVCERPSYEKTRSLGGGEETEKCKDYIRDHFNAGSCFEDYHEDDDFLSNEWRVWVDKDRVLDPSHDWVRLFNREGKMIDERTY